jgi:serine-type D-Ala-D-Ala carboxypeptidase/endopeptidase (penicillin-binding protein 4)
LLVNFRAHRVRFMAQHPGRQPRILIDPEITGERIVNRVKLGSGACGDWKEMIHYQIGPTIDFSGQFPASCEDKSMHLVLQDNNRYFGALFKQLWAQLGGTWRGRVVEGPVGDHAVPLAEFQSPPLAEIIRDINKHSNNVMARHAFLTLGAEMRGTPASNEKSADAMNDWLAVKGQRFLELVLENGAGLSRNERISAQHLAWVLRAAFNSSVFAELESSLPIVAADGTMKKRLVQGNISGHAHIKSGSLKDVRAIAGYVFDAHGRRMIVVCFINHTNADQGAAAQDALLEWVYGR